MATVQLFNREDDEAAKFEGLNVRHRTANLDSVFYYSVFYRVVELVRPSVSPSSSGMAVGR